MQSHYLLYNHCITTKIKVYFCHVQKNHSSQLEFIALMAALMSVTALAIDALLPALDIIGIRLRCCSYKQIINYLITMIFLGLGLGPLLFGPLSDAIGRKPSVYYGFWCFFTG